MAKRRPRVLVVEDEELLVRYWSRTLADLAEVEFARSFELAWQRTEVEAWKAAQCDYVFLDLGLPDGDGADLLPRLEALEPRPLVAVFSEYLDARRYLSLRGRCALALPKPVDGSVLRAAFHILEKERSTGSIVAEFAALHRLSPQETKLLHAALRELSNEQAAELLSCAHSTVRTYWGRIFQKVGCHSERAVFVRLFRFAAEMRSDCSVTPSRVITSLQHVDKITT